MDVYPIRQAFAEQVAALRLPQFFQVTPGSSLFEQGHVFLERDALLSGFQIADCDVNDFAVAPASGDLIKLDLLKVGESAGDYEPTRVRLKDQEIRRWRDYLSNLDADAKRRQLSGLVNNWIGKMPPLADSDLLAYIKEHDPEQTDIVNLLKDIMAHAKVSTVLSTFIPALKTAVPFPDGSYRVFGCFNLGGTVSGRLSSSDPNLQNLC